MTLVKLLHDAKRQFLGAGAAVPAELHIHPSMYGALCAELLVDVLAEYEGCTVVSTELVRPGVAIFV
jgi:hypothetical protein